ncbi:hypothetical protein KQI63_04800 [bacterium]|nr:hypothetical protein [bacterium]
MNLAFYVTGHGYGHLTRTLAVIRQVQKQRPDVGIHIRAPYREEMLLETLEQHPSSFAPIRLDIGLVALDSIRHDLPASVEKLTFFYGPEGDKLVEQEAVWLKQTGIDAALIDISPRAFEACQIAGVPAYGCSNFSWDDIWRDLAKDAPELERFVSLASEAYSHSTRLFRLPMHIGMASFPVVEQVPLVARASQISIEETRSRLGLQDETRPLVLLAFGGEGLRGARLARASQMTGYRFVVTPPIEDPGEGYLYLTDADLKALGLRYNDLVRAMDVVLSKPGYSTVAETAANHSGLILTDRTQFMEAPAIIGFAEQSMPFALISNEDLFAGRWEEAIETVLAQLPYDFSGIRSDGAEVVAKRLLTEVVGMSPRT